MGRQSKQVDKVDKVNKVDKVDRRAGGPGDERSPRSGDEISIWPAARPLHRSSRRPHNRARTGIKSPCYKTAPDEVRLDPICGHPSLQPAGSAAGSHSAAPPAHFFAEDGEEITERLCPATLRSPIR